MIRVAILGSCVTACALEYAVDPLVEVFYSSRTSFATMLTPPLAIGGDALPWSGNFARKRVLADFRKTVLDDLVAAAPDAIVFDFVDDRHDLLRAGQSLILDSEPLRESGFPGTLPYSFDRIPRLSPECNAIWRQAATRIAAEFQRRLPSAKLLLHRAWWAEEYLDDSALRPFSPGEKAEAVAMNALLEQYYAHWESVCPGVIPIEVDLPCRGWKQHKWDLAPFHYETAYYHRLLELIEEAVR